jgi:hypothetical protein
MVWLSLSIVKSKSCYEVEYTSPPLWRNPSNQPVLASSLKRFKVKPEYWLWYTAGGSIKTLCP